MGIYIISKRVGETPLSRMERFRKRKRLDPNLPMTYAGRLDPMASGKLLILTGEDCKHQEDYRAYNKEYQVDVLLGVTTDTGDMLGIPSSISPTPTPKRLVLKEILRSFVGQYHAPYPHFSSKVVEGKPLFLWTLENRIHEISIPHQNGRIHAIHLRGVRSLGALSLLKYIQRMIAKLPPTEDPRKELGRDFRKDEILEAWDSLLSTSPARFYVLSLRIKTTSGVYMRTLAQDIGRALTSNGMALSIHRTGIRKPQNPVDRKLT